MTPIVISVTRIMKRWKLISRQYCYWVVKNANLKGDINFHVIWSNIVKVRTTFIEKRHGYDTGNAREIRIMKLHIFRGMGRVGFNFLILWKVYLRGFPNHIGYNKMILQVYLKSAKYNIVQKTTKTMSPFIYGLWIFIRWKYYLPLLNISVSIQIRTL